MDNNSAQPLNLSLRASGAQSAWDQSFCFSWIRVDDDSSLDEDNYRKLLVEFRKRDT